MSTPTTTPNPSPSKGQPVGFTNEPADTAGDEDSGFAPSVRGEPIFKFLELGFLKFDQWMRKVLPDELNPFLRTGSIAVISVLIATVTGVALLLWYKPSVTQAYSSVAAMGDAPFTAGFVRSLHRYSCDFTVFFALVHALRLFSERRFTGVRWLAWITGIAMLGLLWFIGWSGYWLVWDQRAQHVAVGTAKALDIFPIFADPMGRSFLVDESVNSLLFFVVFFIHMLIPLAFAVATWLHLARLSRPKFLTTLPLTIWATGSMVLLCIVYPATNAGPANMTALGERFTMDGWYLLPIALSDRLSGGPLVALLVVGSAVIYAVPWIFGRGRALPAVVDTSHCDACTQCYQDCPYNAITMIARTDGKEKYFASQADVDPNHCVGCGICAGSCNTAGNGLDYFHVADQRKKLEGWLKDALAEGETPFFALTCAESVGSVLNVDPNTGKCPELPGYRVLDVPCVGWIHMLTLERLLRRKAGGVLVVSCGPSECYFREGADWFEQRLNGERKPVLRTEYVDRDQIQLLALDRTRKSELIAAAQAFREDRTVEVRREPTEMVAGIASVFVAIVVAAVVGVGAEMPYVAPGVPGSEFVVTFKHPGTVSENCRTLTPEELAATPVHMRKEKVCDRKRSDVRLRVVIDGEVATENSYAPKGVWGDGSSVAVEQVAVEKGEHEVEVSIGDGTDLNEWKYSEKKTLVFEGDSRRVLIFDRQSGFSWY